MASGRQSDISADTSRSLEAGRIVNRCLKAKRGDRADTRHGHEPSDLRIVTRQLQNLTVEIVDLLFNGLARLEQRPDHSDQLYRVHSYCRANDEIFVGDPTKGAKVFELWRSKSGLRMR